MAIKMYQYISNSTTRKIRLYLKEYDLEFSSIKICEETFPLEEFLRILSLTEGGAYELLSDRSTVYKKLKQENFDFESMKLSELYDLVIKNPSLLKAPIVVDYERNKLVVGNDMELLAKIVPKELRVKV